MVTNIYELMFILNPELAEDEQVSYLERVRNYLVEAKAEVYNFKDWGLRRLAYTIKGHREGHYYLVHFSVDTQNLAQFEHSLQLLSEGILRELITCPPKDFVPEKVTVKEQVVPTTAPTEDVEVSTEDVEEPEEASSVAEEPVVEEAPSVPDEVPTEETPTE